jgi:hypothetical protein
LDFGFWILDWSFGKTQIRNPKSEIQNRMAPLLRAGFCKFVDFLVFKQLLSEIIIEAAKNPSEHRELSFIAFLKKINSSSPVQRA